MYVNKIIYVNSIILQRNPYEVQSFKFAVINPKGTFAPLTSGLPAKGQGFPGYIFRFPSTIMEIISVDFYKIYRVSLSGEAIVLLFCTRTHNEKQ